MGIGRINDDRRNYYALTYTPANAALDGTYRKIEVKVKRPGVEVRARAATWRLRPTRRRPSSIRAAALAAIMASPRPSAFAVQSRALSVPMPDRLGLTAIVASFTGDAVTFSETEYQDVCRRRDCARECHRRLRHAIGETEPAVSVYRGTRRSRRR